MKFTVKKFVLQRLVAAAGAIVPAREVRPELGHFLVQVRPGQLRLTATDLDLAVVATTPSVLAPEEGQFLLPAAKVAAILKEAIEGDVVVEVNGLKARLDSGNGNWDLVLLDALERYPQVPDPDTLTFTQVDRAELASALKTVRYAASKDGARPGLACVAITRQSDGSAKVTASDSARFQQARLSEFPFSTQIPAIGSPAAVDELAKLLGPPNDDREHAGVTLAGETLVFQVGNVTFATGPLMARPTDVEQQLLTPAMANKDELGVSRDELLAVIRRVRINADPDSRAIGLDLSAGKLKVFASDKSKNMAQETMDVAWAGSERTLVVHHEFLTQMLAVYQQPQCRFLLGSDTKQRKSLVLLRDDKSGATGVIQQMHPKSLGLV